MSNDSSKSESDNRRSALGCWVLRLQDAASSLTRSETQYAGSTIDKTRRSVLRDTGTVGALTLGGTVPSTAVADGPPQSKYASAISCHDPDPPETCEEMYEAVALEILRLRELVNQCHQAQERAIERNTHLRQRREDRWWRDYEADFPNGIWGGVCRASAEACGLYPVPNCRSTEDALRDAQNRLNEPCEDVQPSEEEIDLAIEEQIDALEDILDQLNDKEAEIQQGIDFANHMIGILSLASGKFPPVIAGVYAWLVARRRLIELLRYIEGLIEKVQRRLRDLERCKGRRGAGQPNEVQSNVQPRYANAFPTGHQSFQLARTAKSGSEGPVSKQDDPFNVNFESIDYSFESVSKFEPRPLQFDPPENRAEATMQAVSAVGLYLGFAQADLTLSLRRYAVVSDLRIESQSMIYEPTDLVRSLAETELEQMKAVIHNATASASLVDEWLELQSDVNTVWEELDRETLESSPEEITQRIQQWWSQQENRDDVFAKLVPSERGWDTFQTGVTQELEELDEILTETPDREVLFDEEWAGDMRALSESYRSLAESFREFHSKLRELWNEPPRRAG